MDHNTLWIILKEFGISDHLTCRLRNRYACQEAIVKTRHRTMDRFQLWKGIHQGCVFYPIYLIYIQSTSCKMLGWLTYKLGSGLPGEISITSDMQMTPL